MKASIGLYKLDTSQVKTTCKCMFGTVSKSWVGSLLR